MKKITKDQQTKIDARIANCVSARDEINELVEEYNTFLEDWGNRAAGAIGEYNNNVNGVIEAYQEIAAEAQEYFDERTENWQDGDRGQAYQEWVNALENVEVEELDIDLPDPIEDIEFTDWDNVEEILPPSEPEE